MKFRYIGTAMMVLSFTSSVWGDCAWVLWEAETSATGVHVLEAYKANKSDWKVSTAYPTYDGCFELLETTAEATKNAFVKTGWFKTVRRVGYLIEAYWKDTLFEGKVTIHHYKCLPDTVDPRK